jgi:hypothetical protein
VRLQEEAVTEHETVSGEVRNERIDVEDDRDVKDERRGR